MAYIYIYYQYIFLCVYVYVYRNSLTNPGSLQTPRDPDGWGPPPPQWPAALEGCGQPPAEELSSQHQ